MEKKVQHNIIISGGGTGGHIFPAIAIAQELAALRDDLNFIFVGALGKMEMEKVPKAGYQIIGLPVSAFHRRITLKNLLFPFKLLASMIKAGQIINRYNPLVVIGTGGFASGPMMKAALRKHIPVVIQEQNAFPGITNRLVAEKAEEICVAHEGLEQWFPAAKLKLTGNPVRKDLENIDQKREEGLSLYGLSGQKPVVLIFGGSLGSLTLNRSVLANHDDLRRMDVEVIWQTGQTFYSEAKQLVEYHNIENIRVYPFLEKMDLAYAAADVVVSRAGAITLSELAIAARPCILVPYPAAAGDHQMKNARSYELQGAAWVVPDQEIQEELVEKLLTLLEDEPLRKQMSSQLASLARPAAGKTIAESISQLINKQLHK